MRTVPHSGTTYLFPITHMNHRHFVSYSFSLSSFSVLMHHFFVATVTLLHKVVHTWHPLVHLKRMTHIISYTHSLHWGLPLYEMIVPLSPWIITFLHKNTRQPLLMTMSLCKTVRKNLDNTNVKHDIPPVLMIMSTLTSSCNNFFVLTMTIRNSASLSKKSHLSFRSFTPSCPQTLSFAHFMMTMPPTLRLLRTQESAPGLDKPMTVGRSQDSWTCKGSQDSWTCKGSHAILGVCRT